MVGKARLSIFLVLLTFLISAGCREKATSPTTTKTTVQTLVVGAVLSLTGGAAAYGEDADKGARLAVDKINAQEAHFKIQYVPLDDKSDKTEAAKVARTLVDGNGAQVILGPAISPSALSVGKFAEERKIPMIATSATQDEVTASAEYNREYVSRVCFNDSYQGRVLAHFVFNSLKKTTAAIIYDKTLSYSIGLSKTFSEEFSKLGGNVKYEENYSVKDTDYSALVNKVARFDVEVLFIPGWDENVGPMLKQAGNKWDKFTLVGGDGWPTNRLLELAGGNIKNAYAVSHYAPDDPSPLVKEFHEAFRKKYNEDSSPFSALGYDAMMLIWDAAKRARSLKGADLKDAINATRDLRLVTGSLTFDQFRNPMKDAVLVKILPDKIVFYSRVKP